MLPNVTFPRHSPSLSQPVTGALRVTPRGAANELEARAETRARDRAERSRYAAKEEVLEECESIWKQLEECQSKLKFLETETLSKSNAKLSLSIMHVKALTAEYNQWQKRSPEMISTNPDVLLSLGKKELEKVKDDLENVLSTVQLKNKSLEEELKREQQWYEEQKQLVDSLSRTQEKTKRQLEEVSKNRAFHEQKILELKVYKKKILTALEEFLEEHFPPPEKDGRAEKKNSQEEPVVELKPLHDILEILLKKFLNTPHEPYVTIDDSFWPPYLELLLRHGIAQRHPENPGRMRLEAFHE
ncbi:LOW QUALITY PROTEIN: centromere protein K [Pezoporus occidentalis]|uniref:LOW QUALITY PROTEIN: centromere protein K n=1 Tax=Pezoporus occidentalis TaxID=407982 RepID=UPI002F908ADC